MKGMAFLVFVSCCVSAFCLGILSYTLTTGELPFDLKSVMDSQMEKVNEIGVTEEDKLKKLEDEKMSQLRSGESFAVSLYNDLESERNKLKEMEEELKDRENRVEALEKNVKHLQGLVDKSENKISKLLSNLDAEEIENLKTLANLVGEVEIKSGAKMLFDMDQKIATRVLYYMKTAKAALVLSEMISDKDPKKSLSAVQLAESMRTFTPEISMNDKK